MKTFFAVCVLFTGSCSGAGIANNLSTETVLVGSTPGGDLIKSLLTINPDEKIDFIRWELTLNENQNESKTYILNINFGEGQPNTNGFKDGGKKLSLKGLYTVSKSRKGDIYELKNETSPAKISMVKLNDNLFHLLTPDNKFMIGNGGWSYTLSRKDSSADNSAVSTVWTTALPDETAQEVIFEGRTPCLDFAKEYNLQRSNECSKLKWLFTLFRDAGTNEPTTYALRSTLDRSKPIEGKWKIVKGLKNNAEAIIYQLELAKTGESLSFLVGDENVLFFLDKENNLFTGNSDFSFTLNRRKQ